MRADSSNAASWLCLLLLAAACSGPGGVSSRSDPTSLRIGISPERSPLAFRAENSELRGIEPDLARLAASRLQRQADFVILEPSALLPSLEAGRIDVIMSGLSISRELEERVLFTHPYARSGQLALIRSRDRALLGHADSIRRKGARVGFIRGSPGQSFVEGELSRGESYAFERVEDGIRSLRGRRIDFMILDAPTLWRLARSPETGDLFGLSPPLTEENLAWAVAPDNSRLRDELDLALDEWRASNQLQEVLKRWLPKAAPPIN